MHIPRSEDSLMLSSAPLTVRAAFQILVRGESCLDMASVNDREPAGQATFQTAGEGDCCSTEGVSGVVTADEAGGGVSLSGIGTQAASAE